MGSPVLTATSVLNYDHGGTVNITATQFRVRVSGQPMLVADDVYTPAGCAFVLPSGTSSPCASLLWAVPSLRVKASGRPIVTTGSTGLSLGATQAPQGSPIPVSVQPRVSAQ